MSRKRQAKLAAVVTQDSFANFGSRVGLGTSNQNSGSGYALTYQSHNRLQLEAAYRGSWIVQRAVDVVAEDMTRAGIEISGLEPDDITKLERVMTRLQIWERISDTVKWSRLYGGCLAVILIEGQDLSTPLRVETVGKGQFKGLMVLDRWMVNPPVNEVVTDFGPEFGMPEYYYVLAENFGLPQTKVHHSRVIRMDGIDLPYNQRIAENGWGLSILEPMYDRIVAFDSTTNGVAQLVYKAHLRVIKIAQMREIVAAGGTALAGLNAQLDMIRRTQSNEGLTVLDASDDFEAQQYGFSGLSDVLARFAEQLSGATGIPLTRLFGQPPGGLSTDDESGRAAYYDAINQKQERRLRNGLQALLEVMSWSVLGKALPEDFGFEFRHLEQMNEAQKSDISGKTVDATTKALEAGLITRAQGMRELKAAAPITGMFGDIPEQDIANAEQEEPPTPEIQDDAPEQKPESLWGSLLKRITP